MKQPRLLYPILAFGILCIASSSVLIRLISGEADGLAVATYRTLLATLFFVTFFSACMAGNSCAFPKTQTFGASFGRDVGPSFCYLD